MYSFFELSGTPGARAAAAAGSLIITMVFTAPTVLSAIFPASQNTTNATVTMIGALA